MNNDVAKPFKVVADYIWLGGENEFRVKTRVLELNNISLESIPNWNYDGSSTGQATSDGNTEIILVPVYMKQLNSKKDHLIIVCATYYPNGTPLPNNHYDYANTIFSQKQEEEPWFGLEQEYFIMDSNTHQPIGYEKHKNTIQGQFYCGVGGINSYGRKIVNEHLNKCLDMGLNISGTNQEVAVGQWEFQIGPVSGIEIGHQMMLARYLLEITAEENGYYVSYEPKLLSDWNGSGCHINYSTKTMREEGGLREILKAVIRLKNNHQKHIESYGKNNEKRLTGKHETSSMTEFTWGFGTRNTSVRIGNETNKNGYGYFEDRRPAANVDPYLSCALIFETTILSETNKPNENTITFCSQ